MFKIRGWPENGQFCLFRLGLQTGNHGKIRRGYRSPQNHIHSSLYMKMTFLLRQIPVIIVPIDFNYNLPQNKTHTSQLTPAHSADEKTPQAVCKCSKIVLSSIQRRHLTLFRDATMSLNNEKRSLKNHYIRNLAIVWQNSISLNHT